MEKRSDGKEESKVVRAAGVVCGATIVSRLLGLVRDAVLAFLFGASPAADAFFVAFRIPNLMRQLFGEGALTASFVPVYTDVKEKQGEQEARKFSNSLFAILFIVLVIIALAGVLLAPWIVRGIAWGFEPGSDIFNLTVLLTRWMFPYMIFICMAALGMGMLNANDHFLTPALAPALLNISIICFALFFAQNIETPILAVAWGVLVGGILQVMIQYPPMKFKNILPAPVVPVMSPEVRRMMVLMGPAALGVAVYQVNILIDTLIASFLPQGSITYLWYGNRMMQFPLGVFGIALATAALPTLSRQIAEGRRDDFSNTVSFSLTMTAFIGIPSALGLIAIKEPVMATLFARGAFSAGDVAGSASALHYYVIGLPFFIGIKILGRAFFALENTRIPFAAAAVALVANTIFNLLLMGPMGHAGLALGTSLASLLNFAVLAVFFTRKVGSTWSREGLIPEVMRSGMAAIVMFLATSWVATQVEWMQISTFERVMWLLGCVGIGIVVYSFTAMIIGSKNLKTEVNHITRKYQI